MRKVFYPAKGQNPKTKKDRRQSFLCCVAAENYSGFISYEMEAGLLFAEHRNRDPHHHIGMESDVDRMIADLLKVACRHAHL